MSENPDSILVSQDGPIRTITLNRPSRLNAIDLDTHIELEQALREADLNEETRVLVLTGSGRAFCSGGDVKQMRGKSTFGSSRRHVLSPGWKLIQTLMSLEKPLIAMVNGPAVGLGATIALFCDVVVMSEEATIGDRHVNVGLVAGDGGAVVWPLLIGPMKAKDLLMTGEMINGREAARLGLIRRVVAAGELESTTQCLANELASQAPYALMATKLAINKVVRSTAELVLETSLAYEHVSMSLDDHQEALAAREDGRTPTFREN